MTKAALPNGIELEYETFGSPDDPTLLLIMGLGGQLVGWDEGWCEMLAGRGRHVVRYDNRDVGLSSKLDGQHVDPMAIMMAAMSGGDIPPVPYDLSDMAADAVGLLDHLGVERAHVMGISMGGMIAQTMAIEHPQRMLSLTSIMSTVGDHSVGSADPEAMAVLMAPPSLDRAENLARVDQFAVFSSRRFFDPEAIRPRVAAAFDRCFYPEGVGRQIAAIMASGDRSERLRSVEVPTLVIHGLDDRLIHPSGGRRTAELIPAAHLMEVADMGHDLPAPLWPMLVGAIVGFADVAAATGSSAVAR